MAIEETTSALNVRLPIDLHRRLKAAAALQGVTLEWLVCDVLAREVARREKISRKALEEATAE